MDETRKVGLSPFVAVLAVAFVAATIWAAVALAGGGSSSPQRRATRRTTARISSSRPRTRARLPRTTRPLGVRTVRTRAAARAARATTQVRTDPAPRICRRRLKDPGRAPARPGSAGPLLLRQSRARVGERVNVGPEPVELDGGRACEGSDSGFRSDETTLPQRFQFADCHAIANHDECLATIERARDLSALVRQFPLHGFSCYGGGVTRGLRSRY
jgi:hypothetical protein